jgi:hypothetical protein
MTGLSASFNRSNEVRVKAIYIDADVTANVLDIEDLYVLSGSFGGPGQCVAALWAAYMSEAIAILLIKDRCARFTPSYRLKLITERQEVLFHEARVFRFVLAAYACGQSESADGAGDERYGRRESFRIPKKLHIVERLIVEVGRVPSVV